MDAVEYLKERARMCKQPLCDYCEFNGTGYAQCFRYENMHPKEHVSIVEKWSGEHPVMTNAMKFEEVFGSSPKAPGGAKYCPPNVYCHHSPNGCEECLKWWDEPYKEPEGK